MRQHVAALSKGANLAPQEIRILFAVFPVTKCQGLFHHSEQKKSGHSVTDRSNLAFQIWKAVTIQFLTCFPDLENSFVLMLQLLSF